MDKHSRESTDLLLEHEHLMPCKARSESIKACVRQNWLHFLILSSLFYIATILTINNYSDSIHKPQIYSPANVAFSDITRPSWDQGQRSKYLHGTQEEIEDAWKELLFAKNIHVPKIEMQKTQPSFDSTDDAVQVSNGDYIGVLGVYHSLHCLNFLRLTLNRIKDEIQAEKPVETFSAEHIHHCIDLLRDDVMCHADLTLYRAVWLTSSDKAHNKHLRSDSTIKCANWDTVSTWARARALVPRNFTVRPGPYEDTGDDRGDH